MGIGFAVFVGMMSGLIIGGILLVSVVYKVEKMKADTNDYLSDRITWEELQRRRA